MKRVPMSYQNLSIYDVRKKNNEADVLRFLERVVGHEIEQITEHENFCSLQYVTRAYPQVQAMLQQKTKKDIIRLLQQLKRKEMSALASR